MLKHTIATRTRTSIAKGRVHTGIDSDLPDRRANEIEPKIASLENYSWDSHCNGLFQMPKAA